jgi:sporulation protein YlmC with PRC-barrel domain
MRKGSALIGKAIVTYDTGEQVGKVADLQFDLG